MADRKMKLLRNLLAYLEQIEDERPASQAYALLHCARCPSNSATGATGN